MKIPNRKYKLGDEIHPIENGTGNLFRKQIYGVVDEIWKKNQWKSVKWFECIDCARLYSKLLKSGFRFIKNKKTEEEKE